MTTVNAETLRDALLDDMGRAGGEASVFVLPGMARRLDAIIAAARVDAQPRLVAALEDVISTPTRCEAGKRLKDIARAALAATEASAGAVERFDDFGVRVMPEPDIDAPVLPAAKAHRASAGAVERCAWKDKDGEACDYTHLERGLMFDHERKALRDALTAYGHHADDCEYALTVCTCGFTDAMRSLFATPPTRSAAHGQHSNGCPAEEGDGR